MRAERQSFGNRRVDVNVNLVGVQNSEESRVERDPKYQLCEHSRTVDANYFAFEPKKYNIKAGTERKSR